MYSIRKRLNVTIISSMILVLLMASIFLYIRVAVQVEEVFDRALSDKAHAMISLTELDEEGLEFDFAEEGAMVEFEGGDAPQYYQLWEAGIAPLLKSPSLGEHNLSKSGVGLGQQRFADVSLPDGRAGRLIEIAFLPRVEMDEDEVIAHDALLAAKPLTLVFARGRVSLDDALFAIGFTISSVNIAVLLLSGLLIWRLVGSGLSPLSSLAKQVGVIDEASLDIRLHHEGEPSLEIAPIADQLNHLLERLQAAFEREKRFSANVAHELRTPLAELRTVSEVGRMLPDEREQIAAFFSDVGDISKQMEKVVITLLELARSEAGLLYSDPEVIELSRYCSDVWRKAINGPGSNKLLVQRISNDLMVNTDREKLGMILTNLFVNAINYSPDGAEIQVAAETHYDHVVLKVINAATDLKPEDLVHMKDRFWRKQKVQGGSGHSGLGLTLVEALAEILSLKVSLNLNEKQVFTAVISGLPLHR